MKIRRRETKIISQEGWPDVEISGCALDDTIETRKVKAGYIVGYLVPDESADNPFDFDEGLGTIARRGRDASQTERREFYKAVGLDEYGEVPDAQDALTPDIDAVLLDCYEHGGQVWSIAGTGYQCQWDTSRTAGVWYPNEVLRPELEKIKDKGERQAQAIKYAKEALAVFNAWLNGETFGYCVDVFNHKGEEVDGGDASFGYYGADDATAALLDSIKAYERKGGKAEGWQS